MKCMLHVPYYKIQHQERGANITMVSYRLPASLHRCLTLQLSEKTLTITEVCLLDVEDLPAGEIEEAGISVMGTLVCIADV